MKKILFLVLPLIAFAAGIFGGGMLHQSPADEPAPAGIAPDPEPSSPDSAELAWFRFPNQFFVPVMRNGQVFSTMIISLTIEMPAKAEPAIHAQEHRLRDALLRALLIHANTGGFDGNFTTDLQMTRLHDALLRAAQKVAGEDVGDVLIEDIVRQ